MENNDQLKIKLDKIKHKICSLLSKTVDNGATEQEMNSALAKANELMLEFFITENDLKEKDKNIIEKCVSKNIDLVKSGFDMTIFLYDLQELFECKCYFNKENITFFGYETDVELCCYFYQMIARTCLKEKDKFMKTYEYTVLKQNTHGRTLTSSFILGFLYEVAKKMKQMYAERQSNIPQNYGLMVVEKKKNVSDQYAELNMKLNNRKRKYSIGKEEAFDRGKVRGEKFKLIQGIEDADLEDEIETVYL